MKEQRGLNYAGKTLGMERITRPQYRAEDNLPRNSNLAAAFEVLNAKSRARRELPHKKITPRASSWPERH
jgi:hypothetical protein